MARTNSSNTSYAENLYPEAQHIKCSDQRLRNSAPQITWYYYGSEVVTHPQTESRWIVHDKSRVRLN